MHACAGNTDIEQVLCRNQQAGLRSGGGEQGAEPAQALVPPYLVAVYFAGSADQVYTAKCCVVKQIVDSFRGRCDGNFLAGRSIERDQGSGSAAAHIQQMALDIVGQRHVVTGPAQLPLRGDGAARQVDHGYFIRLRNVGKDAPLVRVNLQRLRMRGNRKAGYDAETNRIDHGNLRRVRCAAVAHEQQVAGLVVDHIVGVVGKLQRSSQCQRRSVIDHQLTQRAIGDIQASRRANPYQAVWLAEAGNALTDLVCLQVDDFNRVVTGGGCKQQASLRVHGEVVKLSCNSRQGNCLLEGQGRLCLGVRERCTEQDKRKSESDFFHGCSLGPRLG